MSFTHSNFVIGVYKTIHAKNSTICRIISDEISRLGNGCSLNHIDVSDVTNMNYLFFYNKFPEGKSPDISEWDVSNVVYMSHMFCKSTFDGDISEWDVSSVIDMDYMFADSEFNSDISEWDTSRLKCAEGMFHVSSFNQDISSWDVRKLMNARAMFSFNKIFKGNLSKWKLDSIHNMSEMFRHNSFSYDISNWANYITKDTDISNIFVGSPLENTSIDYLFNKTKKDKVKEFENEMRQKNIN